MCFGVLCWMLWKHGNESVFSQKSRTVEDLIPAAVCFATNVSTKYRGVKCSGIRTVDKIKWKAPNPGWVKVISDGATCMEGGRSSVSGVLRDSHGNWIAGYQRYVGRGSPLNSELWAILHGLELA